MKSERIAPKICPKCGNEYTAPPTLSRVDGRTHICPDCGAREALASLGIAPEETDRIIGKIRETFKAGDPE